MIINNNNDYNMQRLNNYEGLGKQCKYSVKDRRSQSSGVWKGRYKIFLKRD